MFFPLGLIIGPAVVLVLSLVPLGMLLRSLRDSALSPPIAALDAPDHADVMKQLTRQSRTARIAALVSLAGVIVSLFLGHIFNLPPGGWHKYTWSIGAAILGILIMQSSPVAFRQRGSRPQLDLEQRTIWSFGSTSWFMTWLATAAALVAIVVGAGLASSPDQHGNYSFITIEFGTAGASTIFFGWFYGVPVLLAVACLAVVTFLMLWAGMRPAMAPSPEARLVDVWIRRMRTRVLLMLGSGSLAFTLGQAATFIAVSGQLAAEMHTEAFGNVEITTPYSALLWPIYIAGIVLQAIGLALILALLLAPRVRQLSESQRAHSTLADRSR